MFARVLTFLLFCSGILACDGDRPVVLDTKAKSTNTPPVAAVTAERLVKINQLVSISAAGSYDIDDDPLSFKWRLQAKPENSQASLSAEDKEIVELLVDLPGRYSLSLVVSDGKSNSRQSVIFIDALENRPPHVQLNYSPRVVVGQTMVISAANTLDLDGDELVFRWALQSSPDTSQIQADNTLDSPILSATYDVAGTYVWQLIVSDGEIDAEERIQIDAYINSPPQVIEDLKIAITENNTLLISTDFALWREQELAADFHANEVMITRFGIFVLGNSGRVFWSAIGDNWAELDLGVWQDDEARPDLRTIAYDGSWIVIAGDQGTVLISGDGKSWSKANSNTSADIVSVIKGSDAFYARAEQVSLQGKRIGILLRSGNGSVWNEVTVNYDERLNIDQQENISLDILSVGKHYYAPFFIARLQFTNTVNDQVETALVASFASNGNWTIKRKIIDLAPDASIKKTFSVWDGEWLFLYVDAVDTGVDPAVNLQISKKITLQKDWQDIQPAFDLNTIADMFYANQLEAATSSGDILQSVDGINWDNTNISQQVIKKYDHYTLPSKININQKLEFFVLSRDSDKHKLVYTIKPADAGGSPPAWIISSGSDNYFSGVPVRSQVGRYLFTIAIDDEYVDEQDIPFLNLDVTVKQSVFDYPHFGQLPLTHVPHNQTTLHNLQAFDFNNDKISYRLLGNVPSWMSLDTETGVITYKPSLMDTLTVSDSLQVELDDGDVTVVSDPFTVTALNSNPLVSNRKYLSLGWRPADEKTTLSESLDGFQWRTRLLFDRPYSRMYEYMGSYLFLGSADYFRISANTSTPGNFYIIPKQNYKDVIADAVFDSAPLILKNFYNINPQSAGIAVIPLKLDQDPVFLRRVIVEQERALAHGIRKFAGYYYIYGRIYSMQYDRYFPAIWKSRNVNDYTQWDRFDLSSDVEGKITDLVQTGNEIIAVATQGFFSSVDGQNWTLMTDTQDVYSPYTLYRETSSTHIIGVEAGKDRTNHFVVSNTDMPSSARNITPVGPVVAQVCPLNIRPCVDGFSLDVVFKPWPLGVFFSGNRIFMASQNGLLSYDLAEIADPQWQMSILNYNHLDALTIVNELPEATVGQAWEWIPFVSDMDSDGLTLNYSNLPGGLEFSNNGRVFGTPIDGAEGNYQIMLTIDEYQKVTSDTGTANNVIYTHEYGPFELIVSPP